MQCIPPSSDSGKSFWDQSYSEDPCRSRPGEKSLIIKCTKHSIPSTANILTLRDFQLSVLKPITLASTTDTDDPVSQSKLKRNACWWRGRRKNMCKKITIGFGFAWIQKAALFFFKPVSLVVMPNQSTVGKNMVAVHFTTMPCEPNTAYQAQRTLNFYSICHCTKKIE